ncbi:peptidyl-tRNA hydrolase [Phaeobacter sp.]|uniref:peptidyl-tRNA hydrolase n=1 Tax=Phaeobacter sp. TaxID=1902409 RepID=UPI0025D8D545|nr:peptidyl-tRNA hydrolase [Phaeobacter sp.]
MTDDLLQQERILRRRLLLRLLRGFSFENPRFRGEMINDLVPPELVTQELCRQYPDRLHVG